MSNQISQGLGIYNNYRYWLLKHPIQDPGAGSILEGMVVFPKKYDVDDEFMTASTKLMLPRYTWIMITQILSLMTW